MTHPQQQQQQQHHRSEMRDEDEAIQLQHTQTSSQSQSPEPLAAVSPMLSALPADASPGGGPPPTNSPPSYLTGTSQLPVRASANRPHSVSARASPYSRSHPAPRHLPVGEIANIPRAAQFHAVGTPARHPLGMQTESMQSDDASTESAESASPDIRPAMASVSPPTLQSSHDALFASVAPSQESASLALSEDQLDGGSSFLAPLGMDDDEYNDEETNDTAVSASASTTTTSSAQLQPQPPSSASAIGIKRGINCPICLDTIREAFMTACGHSFCYRCISQHLCERQTCPTCFQALESDQIYPNFALNKIINKNTVGGSGSDTSQWPNNLVQRIRSSVQDEDDLDADEIDALLMVLQKKKQALRTSERRFEMLTMRQFLNTARSRKAAAIDALRKELHVVEEDLEYVALQLDGCRYLPTPLQADDTDSDSLLAKARLVSSSYGKQRAADIGGAQVPTAQPMVDSGAIGEELQNKRVEEHYDDLETFYINTRMRGTPGEEGLDEFLETLTTVARHERLRPVATLRYGDSTASTAIVASIEFDRDDEIFAVAGVTRKIKIYDYANVIQQADIWSDLTQTTRQRRLQQQQQQQGTKQAAGRHDWWAREDEVPGDDSQTLIPTALQYPVAEFTNRSKISCLSYSPYIKSQLACSDYDGTVSLWDVSAGTPTMNLGEHEKRAWSVDFSQVDPTRLCSGSDDGKVKIWSTNKRSSVMTIEGKANVCCVRFSPLHGNIMSFGSADHNVHCFDLRSPKQPLCVLRGHRKAVSYTRFLSPDEIISASTDSSLKLWNLRTQECVRTFTGHTNEKNFVGLTTSGSEWIACGSENNTMYAYHRNLSHPVVVHKFGNCNPVTGAEQVEDDPSLFVSAVCWKNKTNTILSANSQGIIKVLDMV
ncbi:WD40-repeat-containing domain protein [Coemansia spiralis]|nr:WD40-repeat-containing domain protein [Coemansia spiralis]